MTAERGLRFDGVAEEYDRVRLGYPAEIVDAACAIEAVDPGVRMVEVARGRVGNSANVAFGVGRFEDVELPAAAFPAAFSARLTTAASEEEQETAERLIEITRTTSTYLGLDAGERLRLEQGFTTVVDGAGGGFPLTLYSVLVTARTAR